jgi:AraC-like DNA-binding protein
MNYLVEGRMNVTEAALAVGYASSGYFSKVFKSQYGDPPKKFVGNARLGKQRTILPKKRTIPHA